MTVKELIAELQKYSPDSDVMFEEVPDGVDWEHSVASVHVAPDGTVWLKGDV